MKELKTKEGLTVTEAKQILNTATLFYEDLFKLANSELPDLSTISLPQLSQTEKNKADSPITMKELDETISKLGKHKAPGLDGLTSEFYKKFKESLTPILLQYFHAVITKPSLPDRLCKGVVTLLPKGDNNLLETYNTSHNGLQNSFSNFCQSN